MVYVHLYSLDPSCSLGNDCHSDTWFPSPNFSGSDCGDIVVADPTGGGGGDSTGTTTLVIEKTAEGLRHKRAATPGGWGKALAPTTVFGVRSQPCVTNTGTAPTDSVILTDHVEYRAPGDSVFRSAQDQFVDGHPGHVQLNPGETTCWEIRVRFAPVPAAEYRNVAQVMINNYDGHAGEFFGPEVVVGFSLPDSVPDVAFDTATTVPDVSYCPSGFTCAPSNGGTWFVAGDDTLRFAAEIRNDSAPCRTV